MTAPTETDLAVMLAVVIGLGLLIAIGVYVWYAWALSRLFPRIGGEGWKGWVPILNEAEILARGGVPAWSVVFYFIPIVQLYGLYLKVVATHRINRRFGRGAGMTVLAILLPPVWATVLAGGAAPYPEGDRLAALQPPGPRRSAPVSDPPARDAYGSSVPSFAPHNPTSADAPALVFPDYAAPPRATGSPPTPAPVQASAAPTSASSGWVPPPLLTDRAGDQPPLSEAAARSFTPPAAAPPAAASPESAPHVSVPAAAAPPAAPAPPPTIRPAPGSTPPPLAPASSGTALRGERQIARDTRSAAPLGGLDADVDQTVVTPRPVVDDLEATVIVARKRGVRRSLVLDDGRKFSLSGASVVIGRNPVGDPGEQCLAISDTTRTLSKTHARLVVKDDEWRLTDLNATNGVVVVAEDGTEVLLDPGESVVGKGRFILGEVGMHVIAEQDS